LTERLAAWAAPNYKSREPEDDTGRYWFKFTVNRSQRDVVLKDKPKLTTPKKEKTTEVKTLQDRTS
jgi:hypothetical protein